ncbi:MAG: hypothetical protein U1F34_09905 [Gammaproteobacteria bacterium]
MSKVDFDSERVRNLNREINALLGLLEFAKSRLYPSRVAGDVQKLIQARNRELQQLSKHS